MRKAHQPVTGIITNLAMRTNNFTNVWYNIVNLDPTDYKTWLPALAQIQKNMETDSKAAFYALTSSTEVQVILVYAEHANNPAALAPIASLTPMQILTPPTNGTVYGLTQLLSAPESDNV